MKPVEDWSDFFTQFDPDELVDVKLTRHAAELLDKLTEAIFELETEIPVEVMVEGLPDFYDMPEFVKIRSGVVVKAAPMFARQALVERGRKLSKGDGGGPSHSC